MQIILDSKTDGHLIDLVLSNLTPPAVTQAPAVPQAAPPPATQATPPPPAASPAPGGNGAMPPMPGQPPAMPTNNVEALRQRITMATRSLTETQMGEVGSLVQRMGAEKISTLTEDQLGWLATHVEQLANG